MTKRLLAALLGALLFFGPAFGADETGLKHAIGLAERSLESGNLDMMQILMEEGVVISQEAITCAIRYSVISLY